MKSMPSGEIDMLKRCGGENIAILREWDDSFIIEKPSDGQIAMCRDLWSKMAKRLETLRPDLLVLDEVAVAIDYGLLDEKRVLDFLKSKPDSLELVMTGQNASQALIEASDLVTDMRKVKHYYDEGVMARKGIEY